MQLSEEQKREVARWIAGGAKLSEVQQRLGEEFGIRLTYMEARFLVDDLQLVPQEKAQPAEPKPEAANPAPTAVPGAIMPAEEGAAAPVGGVCVEVDGIMRPGALVSGKVTFSDGVTAEWSIDQMGRLGMLPSKEGYRPSPGDIAEFRKQLERELTRQGL